MSTTNSFSRSNVNAKSLHISDPLRSSFNLSHRNTLTIPVGRCVPVQSELLLPSDVIDGGLRPSFQFEKIMTPQIGPVRLDTHTFVVNLRRICSDFKQKFEKDGSFGIVPTINLASVIDSLTNLLFPVYNSDSGKFYSSSIFSYNTDHSIALGDAVKIQNANTYIYNFISDLVYRCETFYKALLSSGSTFYYRLDTLSEYLLYLKACPFYKDTYKNSFYYTRFEDCTLDFLRVILYVIKPFFGPDSLFDYLGYPIFSEYSAFFDSYRNFEAPNQDDTDYEKVDIESSYFLVWYNILNYKGTLSDLLLSNVKFNGKDASVPVTFESLDFYPIYSELPLRASYAVWFDYLRNWHIESRAKCLDPDNFTSTILLQPVSTDISLALTGDVVLAKYLVLLTCQYRYFTTDFLNSIQTNASFRHIYSPVLGINNNDDGVVLAPIGDSDTIDIFLREGQESYTATADSVYSNLFNFFPSGLTSMFTSLSHDNFSSRVLYQDLQVMRRANMLEKWLARNYFYPDNYVGRVQARFGIKPSDYNVLLSEYIGGSEQFISGDQQIANVGTDSTPVGQRTLVANASSSDSFSYRASDYCILISFVSLVPVISYDCLGASTKIVSFDSLPSPEFASDSRIEARTADFLRGFSIKPFIGYVPRYYDFRVRGDETHGRYLSDLRSYNWLRDWYSMDFGSTNSSMENGFINHEFSLTPYHLRVHVSLDAFLGLLDTDPCAYGSVDITFNANRALPAAIDYI